MNIASHNGDDVALLRLALMLAAPLVLTLLVAGLQRVLPSKLPPRTLVTVGYGMFAVGMFVLIVSGSAAPPGVPIRDWVGSGGIALAVLGAGVIGVGQLQK